jgi:anti-sigma regulatory factor (Ser/Thr protein kinase)
MSIRTSFAVKNDLAELSDVLDGVAAWFQRNSLSGEFAYELKLIVDGVVSNVIRHGYGDAREHVLKFDLELTGGDLVM